MGLVIEKNGWQLFSDTNEVHPAAVGGGIIYLLLFVHNFPFWN